MQLMYKVLMGGHHLPYPLPGFLTTTLSTQSMKALPAKGLQSFFKSVVEDVTESEYAPMEGNSCAAHIVLYQTCFWSEGAAFFWTHWAQHCGSQCASQQQQLDLP